MRKSCSDTNNNKGQNTNSNNNNDDDDGNTNKHNNNSNKSNNNISYSRHCLDIGTEDSIHQLDRAAKVTIFRLRTGHCQLLSHLHRLKISHSDECACGKGPQTPNHILQSCPTFDALRYQTWPSLVEAHRKLWGLVETLRQTADFALLTGLKI